MYVAVFLFDISYNVEDILLGFYSSARYLTRVISRPNILLFAGKTLLAKLDKFIEGECDFFTIELDTSHFWRGIDQNRGDRIYGATRWGSSTGTTHQKKTRQES